MDFSHRTLERLDHGRHVGDSPDHRQPRRDPRPLEMMGDLMAHQLSLLQNL